MSEEKKGSNICLSNERVSLSSYQKNSCSSFYQEEGRTPIEIKYPGRYILSETDKGKSIVLYDPHFFDEDEAYELKDLLLNATDWQAKNVTIRGIEYPQPRLVAWYGPFPYSYSGTTLEPAEMPDYIFRIKEKVEEYLREEGINVMLNSVLLNLYRHNKDSVSWHSDDELTMGIQPTIASVSVGETRKFEMRRKLKYFEDESSYAEGDEYFVHLSNGSLVVMDGSMQKDWQHRVPKEYDARWERINLTFRTVHKMESLLSSPVIQVKKHIERATKTSCRRKINYDEKTLESDTNSVCSGIVCKTQVLSSDETNRSGNNDCEPSYAELSLETDNKINKEGGENICSYSKITLKTEDGLKEPNIEQDPDLFYNENSLLSNNLNEDKKNTKNVMLSKNIDNDSSYSCNSSVGIGANAGKNKRFCSDSHSISTNSSSNIMEENDCKVKSESSSSAENTEDFIPVSTLTASTTSSESSIFGSFGLKNFLIYDVSVMKGALFLDFALAFKNRVLENIDEFRLPEKVQLELLCKLTDGTQTEENQKLITTSMYVIVDKVLKFQRKR